MKRVLSITIALFILAESLLPAHDLHEFVKLPALIQHFHEHRSEDPDMSLVAFIQLHYNNAQHHEQDHSNHDELPFSDHHKCTHGNTCLLFYSIEITAVANLWLINENFWCEMPEARITSIASSIWQPPRIV